MGRDSYCLEGWTPVISSSSAAFWIIGTGLGEPVMQNAEEKCSVWLQTALRERSAASIPGYESNDELRFHCDGGDCIGMSCIRQAPRGGTNGLVSLFAVYNEILEKHLSICPRLRGVIRSMRVKSRVMRIHEEARSGAANADSCVCMARATYECVAQSSVS